MNIPDKCKVELAASRDDTRRCITEPYLDMTVEGEPVVVAVDGRMLAVVPVAVGPNDKTGYLSADALKTMRKAKVSEIECNGELKVVGGPIFPQPDLGTFPNWRMVVPAKDREVKWKIKLNTTLLADLAKAIGCECVELQFGNRGEAILVKPVHTSTNPAACEKAFGVLMPVRSDKED